MVSMVISPWVRQESFFFLPPLGEMLECVVWWCDVGGQELEVATSDEEHLEHLEEITSRR